MTSIDLSDEPGTAIGDVRLLTVDGAWTRDCTEQFRRGRCDGLVWYPAKKRGQDCKPLVDLSGQLRMLQISVSAAIDDSALEEIPSLEFLDARTLGTGDLNLARLSSLRHVAIDDRPTLVGLDSPGLESVELWGTRRQMSCFEPATSLERLELELHKAHALQVAAHLPHLRLLRIRSGQVTSLQGLRAPMLETLILDNQTGPEVLDLAPLAEMENLRNLTIRGPIQLVNLAHLAEKAGFALSLSPKVTITSAEAARLPPEWKQKD